MTLFSAYSWKRFSAAALIWGTPGLIVFLCMAGCSEKVATSPTLIRWTEPERIASFFSDHLDLLQGASSPFGEQEAFCKLDTRSPWYPFHVPIELDDAVQEVGRSDPGRVAAPDGQGLVVEPNCGLAFIIPVQERQRIFIECRGRFKDDPLLKAAVVRLWDCPNMPDHYQPGQLRTCIKHMSDGRLAPLNVVQNGRSASTVVKIDQGEKALLLLVFKRRGGPGLLEGARAVYVTPRHDFILKRPAEASGHPALAETAFLDSTVRPSFVLTPGSHLKLHPMALPPDAAFHCALGYLGQADQPLELSLTGRTPEGQVHELFTEQLDRSQMGWREIDRKMDLPSGLLVEFDLTCTRVGAWNAGEAAEPLVLCGSPMLYASRTAPKKTGSNLNLVLISLDTLRWDRLGCYGYDRPVSPKIDQLASRSIVFNRAYAQAPYTLASHASLLTSLYPSTHGAQSEQDRIPNHLDLLTTIAARHGMVTASFNGGSFVSHEFGFSRGFDLFCEVDPIADRSTHGESFSGISFVDGASGSLSRALDWIEAWKSQRFFLFLHTFMVHEYLPPLEWAEQFNADCASDLRPGKEARHRISLSHVQKNGISDPDLAFAENMYDATIRAADRMVGEVIGKLEAVGLADRTVIVVTSDHGEEFMEHGSVKHMQTVYDELIRIPLIVYVPDRAQGIRVDGTVNQVDLLPTLLDLLKIPASADFQGQTLLPLLDGDARQDRPVYAETFMPGRTDRRCMIVNGLKYIEGSIDPALKFPAPALQELYHLGDDPAETRNLAGSSAYLLKDLEKRLKQVKVELGRVRAERGLEKGDTDRISPELLETLRKQGYL